MNECVRYTLPIPYPDVQNIQPNPSTARLLRNRARNRATARITRMEGATRPRVATTQPTGPANSNPT